MELSQEALAEAADIHRNHVSYIERGERVPTIEVARNVALALGLPLSKLVAEVERAVGSGD